jgi:hypothetical protein
MGFFILLCGCINESANNESTNSSIEPPVATGFVYINGDAINGATVEAISVDETDYKSNITDDRGAYILNITPMKIYNVTATYNGLRHTVWPVYLDNKSESYNISLTTTPRSTIEGRGYAFHEGEPFPFDHIGNTLVINLVPWEKNHTTIFTQLGRNGSYSVVVDTNVLYTMGGMDAHFYYHNHLAGLQDNNYNITVGPNETALIDINYYLA